MTRASTHILELHTEHFADVMAKAWCHRCQYFYDLRVQLQGGVWWSTARQISDYQEPPQFTEGAARAVKPKTLKRVRELRNLFVR